MSTEEVIEIYIPDDPEIQEFHSLCIAEKLKIIKLGLALYKSGNQKLQYLNNDEWEKQIDEIKATHNTEKERLEDKVSVANQRLLEYTLDSKSRQDIIMDEVRGTEQQRYKSQISHLESEKERLDNKVATMRDDFDEKFDTRLTASRTFYEDKLTSLQDKLDQVRSDYEEKTKTGIMRSQNSTIKGQDGEEYVLGQLNMLFPRAEIEDTHKVPNRGDFIMREDDFTMMIETKNYSKNVQKSEIDKFYRDIDNPANSDIQCAVFVSLQTGICCKDDFEFEIRNKIPILFIHKLQDNFSNLIMAVKFFKLMTGQNGLDLSGKETIDSFKNLSKSMKNNFNKQKTKIDRYYAEHLALMAEQQANTFELYKLVNVKF
jgi:hypothetical protein